MQTSFVGVSAAVQLRLPSWAAPYDTETVTAAHAGAALALLDVVVNARAPHAGVWTQRLALSAAAVAVTRMGRPEDEASLRDMVGLGPEPLAGPAAPIIKAYLWLASGTVGDRWEDVPDVLAGLGARTGSTSTDLAAALAASDGTPCPIHAAATAARAATTVRPGRDALSLWLADLALARWLGWPQGVPLVTLGLSAGTPAFGTLSTAEAENALSAAVLRGAGRALDCFAALDRQARALQALQPRLRTRHAGRVIERLLAQDAVSASGVHDLVPERAARRLLTRLAKLGGVKELTGRATSRLYGL